MPAGLTARCPCFIRWKLDFHATFYLDRGVPADDEATSLGAIGGSAQNGAVAFHLALRRLGHQLGRLDAKHLSELALPAGLPAAAGGL